ncbi:siderophore synthetase [Actinoplanes sp. SE50]|uniref:GNAT family N-acetyltransferase n=1 Tax=unclassified Actinoplanes TaxID=2626549 RepID=UPI00023ED50A|nr:MULTISPECIES: GNAT family N-acetyltransferase [unclassified Actinoplanes]AEV87881.1 Rhizobactin siderophore biosynthesis protein rhbF [Actinoplanes sp. SE50/110]ATO86285.1 siderophore synthetase [Actinoplanes sp. SE50]SLM03700.1 siderophore synthetase [Actinoplanes sp. SE50/110]
MRLIPLDLDRDLELLHRWVTHPRSRFWGLQGAGPDRVRAEYQRIRDDPHHHAWLGLDDDGTPLFLAETYEPAHSELAGHYPVRPGDIGMHVLVAPPSRPRSGVTSAVLRAVLDFCFADPRIDRVVVEPDVRNEAIARKNAEAGFVEEGQVRLRDKVARLSFCTRTGYEMSVPHLRPAVMAYAHRRLIAKAIAEFSHERLLAPEDLGDGAYRLGALTFRARRFALEHWVVDPDSLDGPLDALDFISGLRETLGIPERLLGTYLEEIAATLAGTAWKATHRRETAAQLVHADFPTIETAMTEGHPGFVANNGRIGFGLRDHEAYAPEAGRPVRLRWVAVRKDASLFVTDGDERAHYLAELGAAGLERHERYLSSLGLAPDDYRYLPVHPWQWEHKLTVTFAADVARRAIVPLDEGTDRYRAQQSIRTFFNVDRPDRHYVKTAIAVQNMGFLRGLSPKYMRDTPPINEWVAQVVGGDPELRACGFGVLREVAAIGYTGDAYHRAGTAGAYTRMLAALWRESPVPLLAEGERLATMASLLHRDRAGDALVTALIRESGREPAAWVAAYFRAYLRPIVHCLLAHDLAFMPHGENLILVLADHVPSRVFLKDIGEEVAVLDDRPLPPRVERIRAEVSDEIKELALFTDVFDGFLRHLAGILAVDGVLAERDFWTLAGDCVRGHAKDHPELAGRLNLLRPTFRHSCLNRLQLRDTLQMVDLTDQAGSLIFAGELENPIAVFG